jgi:SAM-dependent methyltransferase
MKFQFVERECPICYSNEKEFLYKQSFSEISSVTLLKGYDVVSCKNCGFCFSDKIPDQKGFDQYYRDLSKYESHDVVPNHSRYEILKFQEIIKFLVPFIKDLNSRIVEIGCSTGLMLSFLKEKGFKNLLGIDPSPSCADTVHNLYKIPVNVNTISNLEFKEGSADLIILIGVLEHIYDLNSSLEKLYKYLSPEGLVYIAVPDASQYYNGTDAPFQEFSLEHINFFGDQSLTNLMQKHGFEKKCSVQSQIEFNIKTFTPMLQSLFVKNEFLNKKRTKDSETVMNLIQYINKSKYQDLELQEKIDYVVSSPIPIIIWGTGTQLLRMMETTKLKEANIKAFVDSNPKYTGEKIFNVEIIKPENLVSRTETILISSRVYQEDIENQIRTILKMNNPILKLF